MKTMKIMKRIITFALALFMLTAVLCACDKDDSDGYAVTLTNSYADYKSAMEKMDTVKSYTLSSTMEIIMNFGTEQTTTTSSVTNNVIVGDDGNIEFTASIGTTASGVTVEQSLYYKDGYLYTEADGEKIKTVMTNKDAMASAGDELYDFGETNVKDFKITDNTDTFTVEFAVIDMTGFDEILGSVPEDLGGTFSVKDFSTKITVDKKTGYVISSESTFTMVADLLGTEMEFDCHSVSTYSNINAVTTIQAPADLDSYQEYEL